MVVVTVSSTDHPTDKSQFFYGTHLKSHFIAQLVNGSCGA